jgi:serine/threonine protein phosphatase PrpC
MATVLSFSEIGRHRVNEDAFLAQAHPADADCWVVCLADGQGGQSGGARAATLACQTALARALQLPPAVLADWTAWPAILRAADEAVAADREAGFTTLIGLCARGPQLAGASCGDSAAFLLNRGSEPIDLTAQQEKNPPVGSGVAVFMPFMRRLVLPWRILILSDGVWKGAGWDAVVRLFREKQGETLLAELQTAARGARTGVCEDDCTAVLLENG